MEPQASQTIRRSPNKVTLSVNPGNAREFDLWRSGYSPLYEMDAESVAARASFGAGLTAYNLANLVIIEGYSSAETLRRTAQTLARSSVDHISLTVHSEGGCNLDIEGRAADIRAGEIFILDMTRSSALRASAYKSLTLVLPRTLLAQYVADLDGLHGKVLPRTTALNEMLIGHMRMLHAQAPALDIPDMHAAARGTAALVAAFAGASVDGRELISQAAASASLDTCRRMIDANLHDPAMGPELLCSRLGVSRAKLYRMFEPLGGVSQYIQQRRLMRAYRMIVDPAHARERISTIATRCGFVNISAFNRAFRQAHGMSPTELRIASTRAELDDAELSGDGAFGTMKRWLHGPDATASAAE
jgi:AraC-like DNA-binding protein/predicted component of type VI protein secretion system